MYAAWRTIEEVVSRHGDTHERIIHVQENRLSALTIHLVIGASLFLLSFFKADSDGCALRIVFVYGRGLDGG